MSLLYGKSHAPARRGRQKKSPAARRSSLKRTPVPPRNPGRRHDLVAVALFALAALSLVALARQPSAGVMGGALASLLRTFAGRGAWLFPPLFLALSVACALDRDPRPPADVLGGSLLLFVTYLAWAHLRFTHGNLLAPASFATGGGVLGCAVAALLHALAGTIGAEVILACTAVVALLLITDQPLARTLHGLAGHGVGGARKVSTGVRAAKERRQALPPATPPRARSARPKAPRIPETLPVLAEEDDVPWQPGKLRVHEPPPPTVAPVPTTPIETSLGPFQLPPLSLLNEPSAAHVLTPEERQENVRILEQTLATFKCEAKVVEISHGPTVTRYEIQLAPGIRVKRITDLSDNIAMDLAAIYVRCEAPIPGKSAIGVEVPNHNRSVVGLREILESPEFQNAPSKLTFALGLDVAGRPIVTDIARMPHLLIGGSTNSGKSVCLNGLIVSLLYRATPDELKLLLIDPKRVELVLFDNIPHLCYPVVKDVKQAAGVLRWALKEMDRRYDLFSEMHVRNIQAYNTKLPEGERKLPFIVIVIDELADLMAQQGPEVESSICRLAALARATGIHMVLATQRPSVDVITGTIKANVSSRIAFAVSSHTDSRTILNTNGAERLVGRGDMLFLPIDAPKPMRMQGAYITEAEIEAVVEHLKTQGRPDYEAEVVTADSIATSGSDTESDDDLYESAVRLVVSTGHASTSLIQRKFRIGYGRAARILDQMETQGIVSPLDPSKGPREVLMGKGNLDDAMRRARSLDEDDAEG